MGSFRQSMVCSVSPLVRALAALALSSLVAAVGAQNISTVAGTGVPGFVGDGAAATSANLLGSNGLAIDRFGNLFIADSLNHRVRKVGLDGVISTVAGIGSAGFSGDGAAANKAALNYPAMIAFTASGELLITDYGNHRVRRVSVDGVISSIAGNGSEGFSGDGAAATAASLNNPIGVVAAPDGSIYIGDAQNHRVRRVSATGIISTVAGTGAAGFSGDGANALSAQLNYPGALALDALGNVFVADYANHRVRKIAADGTITTVAGTGTAGFSGDAATATLAQLSGPFALAIGTNGSLLIADQINNRVRRVSADGKISTVAGGGGSLASGDGGLATAAVIVSPSGVASDSAGQVWVSDRGAHRIRKVASPLKTLTEYRYAASDYFFYTSRTNEKIALDATPGWTRTGNELLVNNANDAGTKPLVRYYFDKVAQNLTRGAHFYTLFDNEIAGLNALNPANAKAPGLPVNEGTEAYAFAPVVAGANGSCANAASPVYRAFRGAAVVADNPTHRYTTDSAVYGALVNLGWNAEGVVFCSATAP